MKSFVQSFYLLTNAFGSAIGEALTPVAYDPAILWMFVGLCMSSFIAGIIIYVVFGRLDETEEAMNALDQNINQEREVHQGDPYRRASKKTY